MTDASSSTQEVLELVREELAWLAEDGYAEIGTKVLGLKCTLGFASSKGRVSVTVDLGRSSAEIWLAPPDPADPRAPISFLQGPRIELEALLGFHGLPSHRPVLGVAGGMPLEERKQQLRTYLRTLKELRHLELAGDWTTLDEAKRRTGRTAMNESVERVRDPQLRAIMRGYRRP